MMHDKLVAILLVIAFLAIPLSAEAESEKISKARQISVGLQKISGITAAGNILLSLAAYTALKIKVGGSVRTRIETECFTDLFSGRFNQISIKLKNSSYNEIPLGNLQIASKGPIRLRYFKNKDKRAGLLAPLMVAVSGEVNDKQISQALVCDTIASKLRFLKLDLPGLGSQYLQIIEPKVCLSHNTIYIDSWLVTAGADKDTGIKLSISATPELVDQRFIVLKNTKVTSAEIIEPEQFAKFAEDLLNPLVDLGRMDRATHAIRLTNVEIDESKVSFNGNILLAPKSNTKVATK